MRFPISALMALALVSACGPTPEQDAAAVEIVRGSKAAQDMVYADCVRNVSGNDRTRLANLAAVANTTPARAPRVICQRVVGGIVSGRITQADVAGMRRGQVSPKLVRVVQGR